MLLNAKIQVDQALIVDEPWVSKIISGEKSWEMRTTSSAKTGWVGLIRKGSGLIVGLIEVNGSEGPFTKEQLHSHFDKHKVGKEIINRDDYKWFHAWKITNVIRFDAPVRYRHPNGAVIWVNLDADAKLTIEKELGGLPSHENDLVPDKETVAEDRFQTVLKRVFGRTVSRISIVIGGPDEKPSRQQQVAESEDKPTKKCSSTPIAVAAPVDPLGATIVTGKSISVVLTQGNINNNHFYLPREGDFFPASMWGGNNKNSEGTKGKFNFHGIELPVETDIDGSKRILRSRGVIGAFFKLHQLSAGDEVLITRNSDFSYGVRFKK